MNRMKSEAATSRHEDTISRQVAVFKALAHETRFRLVEILADEGEKCVCELVNRVGFDQSTISKHLNILKIAGIVSSRKEGLKVIYRLRTPCVYQFMKCIDQMQMNEDGQCVEDRRCALVCPGTEPGTEPGEELVSKGSVHNKRVSWRGAGRGLVDGATGHRWRAPTLALRRFGCWGELASCEFHRLHCRRVHVLRNAY